MLIMLNGMVRSGSTLTYMLLSQYIRGLTNVKLEGFFSSTDLVSMRRELRAMAEADTVHLLKTHYFPEAVRFPALRPLRYTIFYTHRDVVQIAPSLKRMFARPDDVIVQTLDQQTQCARVMRRDPRVMQIAYEALRRDQEGVLIGMLDHLGWDADRDRVRSAVERVADASRTASQPGGRRLQTLRRRALRTAGALGVSGVLRKVLPAKAFLRTREMALGVDRDTMLLPGHVTNADQDGDLGYLKERVAHRYEDWRREFGYLGPGD